MPKLNFSIDSLVGSGSDSPVHDSRDTESPYTTETALSPGPELSPSPIEQLHSIQKPRPINGVTQRIPPDSFPNIPAFLQMAKGIGTVPNPLSPRVGLPSLSPLSGLKVLPQFTHLAQPTLPQHPMGFMPREYPLHPWLLSRHSRTFPQGIPSPEQLLFYLQPFRKQKRVRTAFSPSQLLKLEDAFEKNPYVVGRERKQLAHSLNLSETQVKVWFQNRRTKEKRLTQDDPQDSKEEPEKKRMKEDDHRSDDEILEKSENLNSNFHSSIQSTLALPLSNAK